MPMTNGKQQSSEPFYKREFKQEQFLYEETSNLASEDSSLTEPFQYFVLVFVGLLFAACLVLLLLDLFLPRNRENAETKNEDRRRLTRPCQLHPMEQHSPILPRREKPREDPVLQVPRRDNVQNDLHRRPVNHLNKEVPTGPPAFQFEFNDSTAEHEVTDRPIGQQHNNTRASPSGNNSC